VILISCYVHYRSNQFLQ